MAHFYSCSRLLLLLCNISSVLSALYPTQPIASTFFYCGDSALITWIDTHRQPHVDDLGPLTIKLYTDEDEFVGELAQGVNPVSYSTWAKIPMDLRNDTLYLLRFSAPGLPDDVWTADFTILPDSLDLKGGSRQRASLSPSELSTTSTSSIPPGNLPIKSLLAPTTTAPSSTQQQSRTEITPVSTVVAEPLEVPPRKNGAMYSRADQLEKARFRLLFIVWPAIFGLSMAL